jgi:hypothetical protein
MFWGTISLLFFISFRYSWQGMIWLDVIEISTLDYRHIGASFASFGEWLPIFWTAFAAPIGIKNVGWNVYLWMRVHVSQSPPVHPGEADFIRSPARN